MKTYEEMAQNALLRGNALRKKRNKTKKILIGVLSGLAVCCLALLIATLSPRETGPNQNPTTQPDSPQYSLPLNICFDSIAEIQDLFDAAAKGQEELTLFLRENGSYDRYERANLSTVEDVAQFRTFLDATLLPCRDTYENDFFSLYYYPDQDFEYFCDVDGIRYCFLVCPYAAWKPDGEEVTIVTLDGVSAELREGSYGESRRLFATFYVGEAIISMWANTTNPDEVNLSGFYWGQLVPASDSSD